MCHSQQRCLFQTKWRKGVVVDSVWWRQSNIYNNKDLDMKSPPHICITQNSLCSYTAVSLNLFRHGCSLQFTQPDKKLNGLFGREFNFQGQISSANFTGAETLVHLRSEFFISQRHKLWMNRAGGYPHTEMGNFWEMGVDFHPPIKSPKNVLQRFMFFSIFYNMWPNIL